MEIACEKARSKTRKKVRLKTPSSNTESNINFTVDSTGVSSDLSVPQSEDVENHTEVLPSTSNVQSANENFNSNDPLHTESAKEIIKPSIVEVSDNREGNNKEEIPVEPSAPDMPDIECPTVTTTPLVNLMQGLQLLKQRQSLTCTDIPSSLTRERDAQMFAESKYKPTQTETVREKPDFWSSIERAGMMFGTEHFETAHLCNEQFYEQTQQYPNSQQLEFAKLLNDYRDSMRNVYRKKSEMMISHTECEAARTSLWSVKSENAVTSGKCNDGKTLKLEARYDVASWRKDAVPRVRRMWDEALESAAADFCLHQHAALVTKFNLEECLHSELSEPARLRVALSLLFTNLNMCHGNTELHASLAHWTYFAAHRLLAVSPQFPSLMLIVNHLVRQTRSIHWALPLVQIEITSTEDTQKMMATLSTVLNSSINVSQASEAVEDTSWTVVDQEGPSLSERTAACSLSEQDLVALLGQLPVASSLRRLTETLAQYDYSGVSKGNAVLKSMCGAWQWLETLQRGLALHSAYRDVCDWLCRVVSLVLHCFADLHALTWSACTPEARETITKGLEKLFHIGWRSLEECAHREVALAYAAHLPFQVLGEGSLSDMYKLVVSAVTLEDKLECYHRLRCVTTMAECRPFGPFTVEVAGYLFQLGFTGSCGSERGGWARALLAQLMRRHTALYVHILLNVNQLRFGEEQKQTTSWLRCLELHLWRPDADQLRGVLDEWDTPDGLRALVDNLTLNPSRELHHELARRVVRMGRSASTKGTVPDWMYQALIDLRLHAVEWQEDLNAVPAPSETALNVTPEEDNPLVCMWTVLATSWGHSVPLICECGVEMLSRLAGAGRSREAAHCLSFIMIVMVQSPESIQHTPGFKTLLTSMLSAGPSLASRILGRKSSTGPQLLEQVMRTHLLETYIPLQHGSPRALMLCWLHLLTCCDQPRAALLLDAALECVCLHPDALQAARDHFQDLLQKQTNYRSFLLGRSSQTPNLWLCALSSVHQAERASGLWNKLLWALYRQRDGRINVDGAMEKCGGGPSAEGLTIYLAATAILACHVAHPVHMQLWQLLMSLYLDRPFDAQPSDYSPVGPLFFRGLFKSRVLAQLNRRLQEALRHHQDSLKECRQSLEYTQAKRTPEESSSRAETEDCVVHARLSTHYHEAVVRKIREFTALLEERCDGNTYRLTGLPILESAHNNKLVCSPSECLRSSTRVEPPPKPVLNAPWHVTSDDKYSQLDPAERIKRRLQDFPAPQPLKTPELKRVALLPSESAGPRQLVAGVEDCLKKLAKHARDFNTERDGIKSAECRVWELMPRLYGARAFQRSEWRGCGRQCTGNVLLHIHGTEWCLRPGVEREVSEHARGRQSRLEAFTAPRPEQARLCASLKCMVRRAEQTDGALSCFDTLAKYVDSLLHCPPLHDSVHNLTVSLGEKHVSGDVERCRRLVSSGSSLASGLLAPAALPRRELPLLYAAILEGRGGLDGAPADVVFSHLSKFDVKKWCSENEDLVELKRELLEKMVDALSRFGPVPSDEDVVLVELISRHAALVGIAGQLGPCYELVTRAAASAALPVAAWSHLESAVRTADIFYLDEFSKHQQSAADSWWASRRRAAPSSALGPRAPHAGPAARLAACLTRRALRDLSLITPDYAATVLHSALSWWDAWLVPLGDRAGSRAPVLPWGANDDAVAADLLSIFVDELTCIVDQCKGCEIDLLRRIIWWASSSCRHGEAWRCDRDAQRAAAILRELSRLPWQRFDWYHASCLQAVTTLCRSDEGRAFCVCVLRATRRWLPDDRSPGEQSVQLARLVYLLTDLTFPYETLELAADSLPWTLLKLEDFEAVLEVYFHRAHRPGSPVHRALNFLLILSAATLHKRDRADTSEPSVLKRLTVLSRWTRALGETWSEGTRAETAEGAEYLLRAVEDVCEGDDARSIDSYRTLLERAAAMLSCQPLSATVLPVWTRWVSSCGPCAVRAGLRVARGVTAAESMYRLGDELIKRHLVLGGSWSVVMEDWSDGVIDVAASVRAGCLYCAHAAILMTSTRPTELAQCVRTVLREMATIKLNVKDQEIPIALILSVIITVLPVEEDARAGVAAGATPPLDGECSADSWAAVARLLQPWTESARFQLLRMITMQAAEEPSERFRTLCKVGLCVASVAEGGRWDAGEVRYHAVVSEMADLARSKELTVLSAAAGHAHSWLSDRASVLSTRHRFTQLAAILYPECTTHFRVDTTSLT